MLTTKYIIRLRRKWFDNKRQSERIGLRKRPRDSKSAPTLAVQRKRMCSKLNTTSIPQTPKQEEAHSEPPWSDIDDAMLFQAVKSLGVPIAGLSVQFPQWPDIAKYVPGRTSNQCHERWCYHVDATINRELWSEDKSQEQLHAYNQWNSIWTDTAFQSPVGWTDIACAAASLSSSRWRCELTCRVCLLSDARTSGHSCQLRLTVL